MRTKQNIQALIDALSGSLETGDAINEAALLVTLLSDDAFYGVTSAQDLPKAYEKAEGSLGQSLELFKNSKLYNTCSGAVIDQAIHQVRCLLEQEETPAIVSQFIELSVDRGIKGRPDESTLPAPIMDLAVQLLGSNQQPVTLQHTFSLSSLCTLQAPEKARLEVLLKATPLSLLVTHLLGATLQIKAASEIFQPSGASQDWVIAAPPMALKLDTKDAEYRYSHEASLNKMLSEVGQKGVLLTPAGLLTQRSSYSLREKLIEENALAAVIQLPKGVLKFTNIAPVLLLIDRTRQPGEPVQFHELESLDETQVHDLIQSIQGCSAGQTGALAYQNDAREQDYDLTVNRYKLGPATQAMAKLEGTVNLEGLAKIIKTQNLPTLEADAEDEQAFFEIAPKDITENGCIATPEKKIVMDAKYQRRANNQRVQAGDILLVIKGSVTKVGYVPKDCPDNWIAGQSFLILRPSPKIGTEYLFQYLNSELVQGYLKERTLGEVMTIIKAADVESIPVPLPEPRELKAVRDTHEQIQAEYAAIEQHRQVIGQLKSTLWSLPN